MQHLVLRKRVARLAKLLRRRYQRHMCHALLGVDRMACCASHRHRRVHILARLHSAVALQASRDRRIGCHSYRMCRWHSCLPASRKRCRCRLCCDLRSLRRAGQACRNPKDQWGYTPEICSSHRPDSSPLPPRIDCVLAWLSGTGVIREHAIVFPTFESHNLRRRGRRSPFHFGIPSPARALFVLRIRELVVNERCTLAGSSFLSPNKFLTRSARDS